MPPLTAAQMPLFPTIDEMREELVRLQRAIDADPNDGEALASWLILNHEIWQVECGESLCI